MRVIVLSDRMIGGASAYSKITYEICVRLAEEGHSMAHIPMGRANLMGRQTHKRVLIYDSGYDPFGEDVAIKDYAEFKADMLITNKEPWVFNQIYKVAFNWVPMAIIDHAPVSPSMVSRLHNVFKIIAISRFGQRELKKRGVKSTYIPNGVRTDIFKPLPDKAACKKAFFLDPDDFTVGIIARNQSRKMIPQMLRGYKRFLELNPDVKSHLYLWMNVLAKRLPQDMLGVTAATVGVNLLPEIYELGLGDDVVWPKWEEVERIGGLPEWNPSGSPSWDMVTLYNAFDVNFLCTGGEAAGMTGVESAACGVPSAVTNYAAAPEYAGPTAIPVKAENYVILSTPGTRFYLADIDGIAEALTKFYNTNRKKLAKKARRHAERYDWRQVIKTHWLPFLEDCQDGLYPKITKEGPKTWVPWLTPRGQQK